GGVVGVQKPGLLTTGQALGRPGLAHLGVPTAGAADRRAFGLANRLVGNRPEAAALEITLAGPELELEAGGWVALTGGRVAADLDGRAVPMDVAVRGEAGQGRGGPGACGGDRAPPRCWAAARPTPWPRSGRRGWRRAPACPWATGPAATP